MIKTSIGKTKEERNEEFVKNHPKHFYSKQYKWRTIVRRYYNEDEIEFLQTKRGSGYIRLFSIKENEDRAIQMLNSGYTYGDVSKVLGCDRSSVMAFCKRKIAAGMTFENYNSYGKRTTRPSLNKLNWWNALTEEEKAERISKFVKSNPIVTGSNIVSKSFDFLENGERINRGKKSYADYLNEYKTEIKNSKMERIKKAKETIEELRKYRNQIYRPVNEVKEYWKIEEL